MSIHRFFVYSTVRQRVIMLPLDKKPPNSPDFIMFKSRLAVLLGFQMDRVYDLRVINVAEHEPNFRGGVDYLCLYTPIIDNVQVGPSRVPLLRTLPFDAENKERKQLCFTFNPIHYYPLKRSMIDTMQVITRDQLGRQILFKEGKMFLTSHLRVHE